MKKSSRIAIIGPVVWGGVWGHGPELARYLGRENSVTYFDPLVARGATAPSFQDTGAYPAAEGVTVVRRCSAFRLGVLYGLAMEWRNFLAVFSSGADHLITYYPLGSVLAMLWCRVRGIRSLFVYADFPDILGHRLARLVARKLCLPLTARLAGAGCVATSRLLCEDLKKFTSRCEHVPNGVGLESLGRVSTGTPSLEKSSSMSHESHPPGKRQLRVGFVGYFGHWVDLDLILETARLCPQHEFVLAGDGPAREGLEARTQEVKNIRFTGVLPHEKVFEEIRLMDLGLIPFKINEVTDRASPVKLFEYWAMGVPVLATACLEIRLVAETAPAGALSFFEGPAELARKIDELAHRPEARRHSRGICLRAVQPYDWKTLGARVEEILKG